MPTKVAINGFGRIGRCIVRAMREDNGRRGQGLDVVAINDLTDAKTLAHLYNYDSVHGRAQPKATAHEGSLEIAGRHIKILAEKDPGKLPWKELAVDIVLECTGLFTDREKAATHLAAGAKKVLISAPAKGHDVTIVLGVNTGDYDASKHHVISNGSCTTNCLAPVAKVLLESFGIKHGLMTTIHSYTNDQSVLDIPHRKGDLRRARAAAVNIIPSSTGAAKALSEVIPSLKGKFDGCSLRVPTVDVSIVDLSVETERPITKESIHAAMKTAAEGPLAGILGYETEPLVSSDYIGDPRSSIFDATQTQVLGDRFAKVFAWYDNEWGFSTRMVELTQLVAESSETVGLLDGIRTLKDLPVENSRVFIRVDFNVPLQDGKITDDSRIREALPTIKQVIARGGRVVLASHLGRPKPGKTDGFSLEPCGLRLAELLSCEVLVPDDCVGPSAKKVIRDLRPGQVCLLENLRFHPEEEQNDEAFARELAELADVYVDDAFGAVHRAHASVHALPKLMRDKGCGLLLEREIDALGQLVSGATRPYVAVLGGSKVSDKIAVVEALLQQVDALVIGGAMANTFLAAKALNVQASRVEADRFPLARTILEKAKERKVAVVLPVDAVVARSIDATASQSQVVDVESIPAGTMILDIGPKTTGLIAERFKTAKTIFWNGPMGLFENAAFARGTFGVARAMVETAAFTVIGGGDSAAAVHAAGGDVAAKVKHISTGGGASLELIEGKKLPGIEVLRS